MLERSSSLSQMGPLARPTNSPVSHLVDHDHLPADLSPRSSNSSIESSNESLLNTSPSMPSPGARENGGSPRRGTTSGQDGVSPLQILQDAMERRSPFALYDDDPSEQKVQKYGMMGSLVVERLSNVSLQGMYKDSPNEDIHQDDDANSRSLSGSPSSSTSNENNPDNAVNTIFQCPLCAVICSSRHDFNEHLVTHSQQHACSKCPFITSNEKEFHAHLQEAHGIDDYLEMLSDDEVKTIKTNAQGKTKTFKCKSCKYTAVTKKDFWDHTKTHIRQEKMLHCPKCPFITEYKHHLEYHLRNHMGSKPYQCTKCPYSCVNKSMLNSHLKSHSNVYQYRCSECSYATKYCHSLKLHLRKYSHKPAMVLNPDGTPNPLPIIDIYGSRRGPKIKRPDPILEGLATTAPALTSAPTKNSKSGKVQKKGVSTPVKKEKPERSRHIANARDVSPKLGSSPRFISSIQNHGLPPPLKKMKDDSSGDSDPDIRSQSFNAPFKNRGEMTHLPQAPVSPTLIAMILQQNQNGLAENQQASNLPLCSPPTSLQLYSTLVNQYLMSPALNGSGFNDLSKHKVVAQLLQQNALYQQIQQHQLGMRSPECSNNSAPYYSSALDLRNPKMEEFQNGLSSNNGGKKHKRKGKALRYERRYSSEDDCNEDEALDFSNNNNDFRKKDEKRNDTPTDLSFTSPNTQCKYCDISFPDHELYTIHMNFHSGDVDPFLCRSCGKKTRDKVAFSRHLNTDPH